MPPGFEACTCAVPGAGMPPTSCPAGRRNARMKVTVCRRERFVVLRDGHLAAGERSEEEFEMADPGMLQGVAAEARKVRETADKLAEG